MATLEVTLQLLGAPTHLRPPAEEGRQESPCQVPRGVAGAHQPLPLSPLKPEWPAQAPLATAQVTPPCRREARWGFTGAGRLSSGAGSLQPMADPRQTSHPAACLYEYELLVLYM